MSRGGRECADWVEAAWRHGARFDAWTELFNAEAWQQAACEVGIDPQAVAQTTYPAGYVMPWTHISAGVSQRFLALERRRADEGVTTPDCTFGKCTGCGVCQAVGADNQLAAPRVANGGAAGEAAAAGAASGELAAAADGAAGAAGGEDSCPAPEGKEAHHG